MSRPATRGTLITAYCGGSTHGPKAEGTWRQLAIVSAEDDRLLALAAERIDSAAEAFRRGR